MKATISGMVCAVNLNGAKDKDDNPIPVTDLYSDGEVVRVRGLMVDNGLIGTWADVACRIQLKDWDGKKYISVTALSEES